MGVLKVNVGDAVTPDWRNIGCGSAVSTVNVLAEDQSTFEGGTSGWGSFAGDNHEAVSTVDAHTGTYSLHVYSDAPNGVYVGRTSIPGLGPSQDFDLSMWIRTDAPSAIANVYIQMQTYDSMGLDSVDASAGPFAISDSWTLINVSGTTASDADHGDLVIQASSGAFGTAFDGYIDDVEALTEVAQIGRLKLWTGTEWVRERCDDDVTPETLFAYTEWTWTASPTQVNSQTLTWRIDSYVSLPANNLVIEYMKTGGVLPGDLVSTGAAPVTGGAGPPLFYTYSMTITLGVGETLGEFRAYRQEGGVTTLVLSWAAEAPLPGHPLKVWDGSAWQTVACMVPA